MNISVVFSQETIAYSMNDFRGAELYTSMLGKGKFILNLNVYYTCKAQIPTNEHVSLFESMGLRLSSVQELKKDTEFIQSSQSNTSCFNANDACLKKVTYTTTVDVGLAYMDYIATWGYCCFDQGVFNLAFPEKQGIGLSLNIPNPAISDKYVMSNLKQLPIHHLCNKSVMSEKLVLNNNDSNDISIQFNTPLHFEVDGQLKYNYQVGQVSTIDNISTNPMFVGSILTNHPPFRKVNYSKDYSAEKPFKLGNINYNPSTKFINVKTESFGKYLISLSIKEGKENKLLPEHSVILITEIH